MKIVIISALGNTFAQRCLDSLLQTTKEDNFDILLVREKNFREHTLNYALSMAGTLDDILFVGDDIEFTTEWLEALMSNYNNADILGMCMLYPGKNKIQDRGYELVQIDEKTSLAAMDRGELTTEVAPFGFRNVDALCGCFMFVKKVVLQKISEFNENGQNRWGEFIFICQARKQGFSVGVIDHYLYHHGKSTKSNPSKRLSSESYMAELEVWETIVREYVDVSYISNRYHSEITESLQAALANADNILLYGAGTVSEHLLKYLDGKNITICSGLPEEKGILFHKHVVEDYVTALQKRYDLIVMTPLYVGKELYSRYVGPYMENKNEYTSIAITLKIENDKYVYDFVEIS